MTDSTPADEPPTEEDLARVEQMLESQPPDHLVRVSDIAPLILRLIGEVRRLAAENRRLASRGRGFDA